MSHPVPSRALLLAAGLLYAQGCGEPTQPDAGADAGPDGGATELDAGPDAGPAPTGCELWTGDAGPPPDAATELPAPGDFAPPTGPGAPSTTFEASALYAPCAYLPMGDTDENHHNTGFFLDGYLVRPWAHERGRGGIAVWDFDDACDPVLVANVLDDDIRETHATGLSNIAGRWISVASLTGIQLWDMSDVTAPERVTDFALEGVRYPDSYMRVVMSTFWQAPYIFVGASDNGIYVVDASDPRAPEVVGHYQPSFRVGQVVVVGTLLYAFSSEGAVSETIDVRDPANPRAIAGGRWSITNGRQMDRFGRPVPLPAYFGHVNGGYAFHPRIGFSAGLAIYDVRDPSAPSLVGDFEAPMADGGYVYLKEGVAFVGFSDYGLAIDVSDPSAPTMVARFDHVGDLDTITPFGNVVVVSVDDDAVPGQASAVMPFRAEVDVRGPRVNMVVPRDGAGNQSLTARVGMTFDEFVEMNSVWAGSVVLREVGGAVVEAHLSGQEGVVSVWPVHPLRPATEYELLVRAGGVTDLNGNAIASDFRSTFTTVACAP